MTSSRSCGCRQRPDPSLERPSRPFGAWSPRPIRDPPIRRGFARRGRSRPRASAAGRGSRRSPRAATAGPSRVDARRSRTHRLRARVARTRKPKGTSLGRREACASPSGSRARVALGTRLRTASSPSNPRSGSTVCWCAATNSSPWNSFPRDDARSHRIVEGPQCGWSWLGWGAVDSCTETALRDDLSRDGDSGGRTEPHIVCLVRAVSASRTRSASPLTDSRRVAAAFAVGNSLPHSHMADRAGIDERGTSAEEAGSMASRECAVVEHDQGVCSLSGS